MTEAERTDLELEIVRLLDGKAFADRVSILIMVTAASITHRFAGAPEATEACLQTAQKTLRQAVKALAAAPVPPEVVQ